MKNDMELHEVIYSVLLMQIQFGTYRFGGSLPTIDNTGSYFLVSIDTIRSAYLRLKQEGYITLSKNVGSTVVKNYSDQEIEKNIQLFFSERKNALIDLSKAMQLMLSNAQWVSLTHTPEDILCNLEHKIKDVPPHFAALHHLEQTFAALGNDLFLQLIWQIFMFFEAPFFSISKNLENLNILADYVPQTVSLVLRKDWTSLQMLLSEKQNILARNVSQFYETKIHAQPLKSEVSFSYNSYKKASQVCYSLAMDLLISISRGIYPVGSLLPSLDKLSKEKNVSVSTVRRALSLLNGVGATKSFQRIGTRVLPFDQTAQNCDFTKPAVRRRLLCLAQSIQILALSCQAVSESTISSMDEASLLQCKAQFCMLKNLKHYELVSYAALEIIERHAPFQSVRTIYGELLKQFFWGYSLRSIWHSSQEPDKFYQSYFDIFAVYLEEADAARFSKKLEELLYHELHATIDKLIQIGIHEASALLVPNY